MRILVLCHEYPPIGGGAAAVCAALGRQYALAGHEVRVLTMGFGDLPAEQQMDGCRVVRSPGRRRRRDMASAFEALSWARRCWPQVAAWHREAAFDVVHAHFIMPAGIVADRLFRRAGVPGIITAHGTDVPGYNPERMQVVHRLVRPWWRGIVRRSACLVSPSDSLRRLIDRAVGGYRGEVIPNGFDVDRFTPAEKSPRILLCGRMVTRKGFRQFLDALEPLDLVGWEVDLVGHGPQYESIAQQVATLRTPVKLHGWVDNQDPRLKELYERAAIFVFPSLWENFSIALLEAMSAGCAIVATDVSGNPEVLGDTGVLIPPDDVEALRRAILELTGNASRREELAKKARRRVESQFRWPLVARRYLDLLESVATGREAAPCASA